jgi:hypothetical protein
VDGFHVAGFWAAFWGAIIVGITNLLLARNTGKPNGGGGRGGNAGGGGNGGATTSEPVRKVRGGPDVIDV